MRVAELMEPAPLTVEPETPASAALELSRVAGVEHLLVMDGATLMGVLCTCDLAPSAEGDGPVSDRMSVPVLTVSPGADAREALLTLGDCGVGCLPVVEDGRVLGVVTWAGLARRGLARPGSAGEHRHHPH